MVTRVRPTDARRDEIAGVAAVLFNDKGFHNTSMEDVADAIGIRKPTLYHYVKSKAQLVSWIHDECVAAVLPTLKQYIADDLAPPEVLRRVAADIFGLLESKPGYLRVFFENHRELPPREHSRARKLRDEYYTLVKSVLDRGADEGVFRIEDTSLTALAFFGMCNWAYQWYRPGGSVAPSDIADSLVRSFLDGIVVPEVSRAASRPRRTAIGR